MDASATIRPCGSKPSEHSTKITNNKSINGIKSTARMQFWAVAAWGQQMGLFRIELISIKQSNRAFPLPTGNVLYGDDTDTERGKGNN